MRICMDLLRLSDLNMSNLALLILLQNNFKKIKTLYENKDFLEHVYEKIARN